MELLTRFLATYLILVLAALAFYLSRRSFFSFLFLALSAYGLAKLIETLIKGVYFIPRPYLITGEIPLTLFPPADSSFPSGHASSAFLLATLVYIHNRRWGVVFFFGAILVGLGRVLSHVHYPIDVVGGGILGIVSALFVFWLSKKVKSS